MMLCTGCGTWNWGATGSGTMEIVSQGDEPARMAATFDTALYRFRDTNTVTMLLSDVPRDDLIAGRIPVGSQVITLDMFWSPKAGATPFDPTATNCTIRHVIFTDGGVGVYGGAGFLSPKGRPGRGSFGGKVINSTARLNVATDDFVDRLDLARWTGSFTTTRDDEAISAIAVRLNTDISRRLGRVFYLMSD